MRNTARPKRKTKPKSVASRNAPPGRKTRPVDTARREPSAGGARNWKHVSFGPAVAPLVFSICYMFSDLEVRGLDATADWRRRPGRVARYSAALYSTTFTHTISVMGGSGRAVPRRTPHPAQRHDRDTQQQRTTHATRTAHDIQS